jgi:transcriptional regulator with XRE-family HTH domain
MTFGTLLRTRRNERGLTLEDVAVRVELSVPHLSRIERDRENPPRDEIIERLAEIIGIPADDLFAEARRLPPDLKEPAGEVFALCRRANRGWTR